MNIDIKKLTQEKVVVYSGLEFIGRVEHYPIEYKIVYFAESPLQKHIAICNRMEDAVKFLLSIKEDSNDE